MKKQFKLKTLLKESDLTDLFNGDETSVNEEKKKKFLEAVNKFNENNKLVYRKVDLQELSKNIALIGRLAEEFTLTEADEWYDEVMVKRDMKSLGESLKLFTETAKDVHKLQQRLESAYEDIGTKLSKYYDVQDLVEVCSTDEEDKLKEGVLIRPDDIEKLDAIFEYISRKANDNNLRGIATKGLKIVELMKQNYMGKGEV